ncbi:MAG TPA: hypothetical protein VFD74_06835 [Thermoleophilia bacterium]|nr:hypothetical protein [Thermoleophilia bacterium]
MARIKLFAEFEAVFDVDLPGVDSETQRHEVEQHRAEVLAVLQDRLREAFGGDNLKRIEYFEFDVERPSD